MQPKFAHLPAIIPFESPFLKVQFDEQVIIANG